MAGQFVSGLVVSVFVMLRGDAVGVRGQIVKFGGALVPVVPALTPSAL